MYEDNAELVKLDDEIAKVKAMIAERKAMYEGVPQPKTQVGWASYIANNDRGMLDKYQDAERQWYTLKEQERHAKELAYAQRIQQDLINMDDIMKNRAIAAANYQYAYAAREADTSKNKAVEAMLDQKKAEAKAALDYWNKRAGFNPDGTKKEEDPPKDNSPKGNEEEQQQDEQNKQDEQNNKQEEQEVKTPTANTPAADSDGTTTEVDISDYKAIKSIKTQADKDATLAKMEAHPAFNNNKQFRDEYNRIKAIIPKDKQAAAKAARRAKYDEAKKTLKGVDWKIWKRTEEGKALIKEFGE